MGNDRHRPSLCDLAPRITPLDVYTCFILLHCCLREPSRNERD